VLQRGASNLYFPIVESAIDIPPWSDRIQLRLGRYWSKLVEVTAEKRRLLVELLNLDTELGMTSEQVCREIEARLRLLQDPTEATLRWEEPVSPTSALETFSTTVLRSSSPVVGRRTARPASRSHAS